MLALKGFVSFPSLQQHELLLFGRVNRYFPLFGPLQNKCVYLFPSKWFYIIMTLSNVPIILHKVCLKQFMS